MVVKRFIDVWPVLLVAAIVVIGIEFAIMVLLLKRSMKKQKRRQKNK